MASCGCRLVAHTLERFGTPSARHYDLAARSIAARIGRKCPRWKHGPRPKIAMVERRKARVPPLRDAGAPRKRPGPLRDISAFTRVLYHAAGPPDAAASGRLSALRPPLIGWTKFQDPGRKRAAGTRCAACWAV